MFHGTRLSEHISKKLHTVIWAKAQIDPQLLNSSIDDKNLETLAELSAVAQPQSLSTPKSAARLAVHKVRQAFEKLGGPKEQENVALIKAAVDRVAEALDTLHNVNIDRVYLISSSPRRDALRDSDIDFVVFVNAESFGNLSSVFYESFKKISADVVQGETSFFFSIGLVDICVSYTPSIHAQPALQREDVLAKLSTSNTGKLTAFDKALYSTACAESLPEFYQRYLKSVESEFYLNIVRLVKLWKIRNISNVHMNPLLLILISLRIAEHHVAVSGEQIPSAGAVIQEVMETLKCPEKICVFFDTFVPCGISEFAAVLQTKPAVIDPTNFFNNLAEAVDNWEAVKEAAVVSLENIKSRRSLGSLFPPPAVLRSVSSPTIVRAAKGA